MNHRDVEFEVRELKPSKWRWTIYPKKEISPKVVGEVDYADREQAITACQQEIDSGLDGKNDA